MRARIFHAGDTIRVYGPVTITFHDAPQMVYLDYEARHLGFSSVSVEFGELAAESLAAFRLDPGTLAGLTLPQVVHVAESLAIRSALENFFKRFKTA